MMKNCGKGLEFSFFTLFIEHKYKQCAKILNHSNNYLKSNYNFRVNYIRNAANGISIRMGHIRMTHIFAWFFLQFLFLCFKSSQPIFLKLTCTDKKLNYPQSILNFKVTETKIVHGMTLKKYRFLSNVFEIF